MIWPPLVRNAILPLLMRRTWPVVRRGFRDLRASQWRPRADVEARAAQSLRALIAVAAQSSPFHRERLERAGVAPESLRTLEDLPRLPILEKEELRSERERILVEGADRAKLTRSATGGTTGEPTQYYWDDAYWCFSSAVSLRAYDMAGFRMGDPHAMIWGTAFHADDAARRREARRNRLRNVLVVPGFDLSEATMAAWAERLVRFRPKLVEGYASLLVLFASFLRSAGIRNLRPGSVVSSAETLHDFQRAVISEAFGAPVFDRYGSREVGCIGAECDRHDGLHVNLEHVIVEIVAGDRPAAPGESGEILVTCLSNRVFPFIRYRIGDLGALLPGPCSCGRGLPLLRLTGGRVHDLITTARGTWLPGEFFPHLFKEFEGVRAFHVHQNRDLSLDLRIVRAPGWRREEETRYLEEIRRVLGDGIPVTCAYVESIERTGAGKLRFTSTDVPVELLRQARTGSGSHAAS